MTRRAKYAGKSAQLVTADTLTDEQISQFRLVMFREHGFVLRAIADCTRGRERHRQGSRAARERLAAIINARVGPSDPASG